MDLNQLRAALLTGESGTTFTFDPANPAFAGTDWAVARAFVTNSVDAGTLVVTGFVKPASSDAVVYEGTVAALLPQQDPAFQQVALTVTAVFWLQGDGAAVLTISVALTSSWTIPLSVSGTQETVLDEVAFSSAALTLSSAAGTDPFTGLVVQQGTWLGAEVENAGVFATVWPLLVIPGGVSMTGELVLATGAIPKFTVAANPLTGTNMSPFPFSVALGAYVTSYVKDLKDKNGVIVPTQFIDTGLKGVIDVGSGADKITFPVTIALASSESSIVSLEILNAVIPIPSWASLQPLTGYSDLNTYLPESAPPNGALVLNRFAAAIDPSASLSAIVKDLTIDLSLNPAEPWVILPNGILSIAQLGAKFSLVSPSGATPSVTMYGVFKFGPTDYRLSVTVPELLVAGELANNTVVPVDALATQFITAVTGGGWIPPFPNMEVYQLDLSASPRNKQYSLDAAINFGWTLEFSNVSTTFETLTFSVAYDGALLSTAITGNFMLRLLADETELYASAITPGDGSWSLAAGTTQGSTVDLVTIVKLLLSAAVNTDNYNLGSLKLTDLLMGIEIGKTPAGGGTQVQAYQFAAATAGYWIFTIGDFEFGIKAAVALQAQRQTAPLTGFGWSGSITGEVKVNDYVLGAKYDFTPTNWSLMFKAYYKDKGITATFYTENHALPPPPHRDTLVKVAFGNMTFGDILEYLVSLAKPGEKVTLGAPWNLLYQINLKDIALIVNFTHSKVSVRYTPRVDFGFIYIEAISLSYERDPAGQPTVTIEIEGRFLGQTYTPQKPLGWDAMNQAPPAVPGAGTGLIDIRYVALGQRVGVPAAAGQNTVQGALDKFKAAMRPPVSATQNPLLQKGTGTELQFDANSRMLFGVEFSLLEGTLTAGAVLWDPYVYGFYVALGGPRAGSLAGLRFELLYKKVTDDIGVFKVELRIPEAFRQFEFGAVSITLGVIKVEIYTNGNFRVDLGFPRNGNFADSFGVQVFPFIGFGGFYFALLNGQTSTTVPKITNGTFNPVIEAGLGLSIGVGKEFNKGVLKAGLSISVYAIIEGTIAWFNPTNASTPKATYFRLQGTAGLLGKLYGEVDFAIIKVSVSLTARASISFVVQSYEPIYITLEVEVRVDASIKILFIKISFSFRLLIKTSFTIGSRSTPPWLLAPGQSSTAGGKKLNTQRRALRHSQRMLRARAFSRLRAWRHRHGRVALHAKSLGDVPGATLNWAPVLVLPEIETVELAMLPAFTLAGSDVTGVMMLSAANTIPPDSVTAEHAQRVAFAHLASAGAPSEAPFNVLVETMLRWAVYALLGQAGDATEISLVDLGEIQREMDSGATTGSVGFSYANLTQFIAKNLVLSISGTTTSSGDSSGTIFPMIPELTMTAPNLPDPVDFGTYNEVGQSYVDAINAYFKQLLVDATADEARDPLTPSSNPPMVHRLARRTMFFEDETESLATVFFRDWFLMLTKSAVQSSLDLLEKWPYAAQDTDSLQSIADQFLREELNYVCLPDDTISSVAALFGMTAEALRALNQLPAEQERTTPGEVLLVLAGVTPRTIAVANQTTALNPAATLTIDGVILQVQDGSTLDSIATTYGLASAIGALGTQNATNGELLFAGATLTVPSFTHSALAGDTLPFLAAFYLSRNGAIDNNGDDFSWYTQGIYQLNPSADFAKPFAAGVALIVPAGYQVADTQAYTTRDNDTQDLVAMYFTLVQVQSAQLASFETEIQNANPGVDFGNLQPGTIVTIPAMPHTIEEGDTLASIAGAFTFSGATTSDVVTPAMLATANASAAILAPLSVLSLPTVTRKLAATDTLGGLAEEYAFSVEEVADAIATQPGLFTTGTQLSIPDVPATTVGALLAQMFSSPSANVIASTVSRFLAYGLRLPLPGDDVFLARSLDEIFAGAPGVELGGLYALVGQQFPAPPPDTESTTISFTSSGVEWISFVDPVDGALEVTLTAEQLGQSYPSTTFTPDFLETPKVLPNFSEEPVRTGLQNVIQWQAASAPPMAGQSAPPANTAGEPTIWLFPESLLAIAETDAATPYQLVTMPAGMGPDAPETVVPLFEWATLVPFTITTLSATASPVSPSYVVSGADQVGRKLLLDAWEHLFATKTSAQLFLLYAPNGASENPSGMASDAVDFMKTYLLKTNLSTETSSGNFSLAKSDGAPAPLAGEYYAGLDASLPFLQLLWEASVTGTGGFVLNYETLSGASLPSSVFSQSGQATVWLLILMDDQSRASNPVRRFYTFNNVAIVGTNIDSSDVNLFAEASDGTHKTRVASIAAGNAGFTAALKNPTAASETAEQRTQSLFSLFGYQVVTAGNFEASNTALPAGPMRPEESDASEIWTFKQVFAAARRASSHPLPDTPALPSVLDDPYAGIGKDSAITVAFTFADIFGNVTEPSSPVADLPIPFGYTDDVIGLASWPGLAISYAVAKMGSVPGIALTMGLRYTTYVAGVDTDYSTAVVAASSHALRYQQVYYQIQQPKIDFTLTTSLDVVQGVKREYPLDAWLFTDVANGAYAFLQAASWLAPVNYTTAGTDTLRSIADAYATDVKALLKENRDLQATDVFAGAVTVPVFHVTAAGDTLSSIAANAGLTLAQLVALGENALAPIPAGTNIVIPPETIQSGNGDTLAIIAAAAGCTVPDVAQANHDKGFITGELLVDVQGAQTVTTPGDSFDNLVAAFAEEFVDAGVGEVGTAAAQIINFLIVDQDVTIDRRVLTEPMTLALLALEYHVSIEAMAELNQNIVNLLTASFPILIGTTTMTPVAGETISSFAEERGRVSVEQLAASNEVTALNGGQALRIPMQTSFSATAPQAYVPYSVQPGDSLSSIAATFTGGDTLILAALDEDIAGTINGGQSVTIGTTTITTQDGDSLASILAAFAKAGATVTLQQLVDAIGGSTTILRMGSVFLVPAPAAAKGATPPTAAADCGVTIDEFAKANAAMYPLLTPGALITIDGVTLEIQAQDTLAKLVVSFASQGVATTVGAIAAKPEVTLVEGAQFLLPPLPSVVTQALNSGYAFPAAMFPVEVDVTIARDADYVDSGFKQVPSVQQSVAPVPPDADPQQGALSLTAYATAFEAAFDTKVKAASSRGVSADGDETRQIWAVNFGPGGITDVTLSGGQTSFFAFEPISTQLESRSNVPIQPYVSGSGLGDVTLIDFASVDMEVWVRDFFSAVDLFLSPAYAAGVFSLPGGTDPHSYFENTVGYKETIAGGIAQNVVPILDAPAPQGDVVAAQQAILQKLLVELSSAYATNAIVQVPSSVTSTLPVTPGSRLSGKALSITYVTGDKDGFAQIAAGYGNVSQDIVALTLADTVGILTPNLRVTYTPPAGPVTSYEIQQSDTLRIVANGVGALSVEDLTKYLTWPSDKGLFLASTSIPASRFTIAVPDAATTFGTLADYFVVTVEDLVIANEDVDGIFSAASLTINGVTKPVTSATNSIRRMAAEFGLTVAAFGNALRDTGNVLTVGKSVNVMSRVPDQTVSVAKVALETGTSTLNFMFTTPAARDFRSMWLNLEYVVNELEYGIRAVPETQGYEDSSWLTFILPIGSSAAATPSSLHTTIGAVRIPIPLREYPVPPIPAGQTGKRTFTAPASVTDAKQWTYAFDYQYEEAAQDTLTLTARFNEEFLAPRALVDAQDLFPPLAQFAAVYNQMLPDLALIPDPSTPGDANKLNRAQVAIATMTDLIGRVAGVYTVPAAATAPARTKAVRAADAPPVPAEVTFTYEARDTTKLDVGIRVFDKFILDAETTPVGPNGTFPDVAWVSEDGAEHPLTRVAETATQCTYSYDEPVDVRRRIAHRLMFPGLDIVQWQSARGGMHVTRNKALILPASPSQTAPSTSESFIYQTPHLEFADRFIPLILQNAVVNIRTTGDMTADLQRMFTELLGTPPNNYSIRVAVEYGYQLVTPSGSGTALVSRLPVVFRPVFQYDDATTAATLAQAVDAWASGKPLPSAGAHYLFGVSFFSSLDSQLVHPLMVLTSLDWPLAGP